MDFPLIINHLFLGISHSDFVTTCQLQGLEQRIQEAKLCFELSSHWHANKQLGDAVSLAKNRTNPKSKTSKYHCISQNSGWWIAIVHSVAWLTVHVIHCCSHRDSESLCEICCYWYCSHLNVSHQNLKQSIAYNPGMCPIRAQKKNKNVAKTKKELKRT